MVSRRVVIGKYADGVTYGLKAALSGFDAFTEADSSPNLSFNSNWTDIAHPLQVGFATIGYTVSVTNPGYVPYTEVRIFSGSTIQDDYIGISNQIGVGAYYSSTSPLTMRFLQGAVGATVLFVTFGIPLVLS